ncbi:cupin domain-containing protein [Alkalihalobacterium elongatum]|uniref:cupin domain-containing protein n=1 Tax=Alkalihalobacterium elongatum TaxID=2675466 RepID=UPI001C200EFA|nr:cupin domain-containing protein [Alkalihalobacterium elongatum]
MSVPQLDNSRLGFTKKNELISKETKSLNIFNKTGVVGEKIWMGHTLVEPGGVSNAHHHQQSDTVHYVLKGKGIFFYGENFENSVEISDGDFIYIPPYQKYTYKNASHTDLLDMVTTMAPEHQVVYVSKNEKIEIPKGFAQEDRVSVVRGSNLTDLTNQTKNMPRKTAIQATNLWIGRVTGEPSKDSGAHHHGDAETAGFIISGTTRILYGDNYGKYEDFNPGDFLRVPTFLPHIERNVSASEPVEFLTARNPKNIVVNLES